MWYTLYDYKIKRFKKMYITFNNKMEANSVTLFFCGNKYKISPESSLELPLAANNIKFTAGCELLDAFKDIDDIEKPEKLKDKIFYKLTKTFVEKMPEMVVQLDVDYEISDVTGDVTVDFTEGTYVAGNGKLADFFDLMPVGYIFPHIITSCGRVSVLKTEAVNKKKFLRLYRNVLLFVNSGLILVDWFFFIPEYLYIKFLVSKFNIEKKLKKLYSMSPAERILFMETQVDDEDTEKKHGCLTAILKGFIVLIVLILIGAWANSSEPDIIISEDFQSVYYFDETFVRTQGKLPEDAKKAFLENYSAAYPLGDGEYDEENYYCFVYEDSKGERYMWLQDNYDEDFDKEYKDYENPMVYKSIGEQETE